MINTYTEMREQGGKKRNVIATAHSVEMGFQGEEVEKRVQERK
jgi:hypothetical protein